MSDSDEDFMSDKFLTSSAIEDIRPGLLHNHSQKRKHDIYKKQVLMQEKKPKTYKEQEQDLREKGLSTAISSENKGFKMLEKMGFKPGTSLGKQSDGLKEPINISLKKSNTGVGLEKEIVEVKLKKKIRKEKHLENIEKEFKASRNEKLEIASLRKDYYKAQRIIEELDFRTNVTEPLNDYFWTRQTMIKLLKKADNESSEDDDKEDEETEPEEITQDKLFSMLNYLRDHYFYCLYCVVTFSDEDDLNTNCPGTFRNDHDEN